MTVWDEAVPELERVGSWRQYYIQRASERGMAACTDDFPVLLDLAEMIALEHGVGARAAARLIAAVGVALVSLENGGK